MAKKIEQGTKEREKAEIFKQQLFTDISHDLKTPITSIQGYSKALYDGVVQGEEKKRRYIKTIYDKSKRLVDLVENVHELAKLGNGNYYIYKEEIEDRKSTRLNSSHANISYAVFCLKKK